MFEFPFGCRHANVYCSYFIERDIVKMQKWRKRKRHELKKRNVKKISCKKMSRVKRGGDGGTEFFLSPFSSLQHTIFALFVVKKQMNSAIINYNRFFLVLFSFYFSCSSFNFLFPFVVVVRILFYDFEFTVNYGRMDFCRFSPVESCFHRECFII